MGEEIQVVWIALISILLGMALFFVRVDAATTKSSFLLGTWPFQFRAFRYGLAIVLIGIGAACLVKSLGVI